MPSIERQGIRRLGLPLSLFNLSATAERWRGYGHSTAFRLKNVEQLLSELGDIAVCLIEVDVDLQDVGATRFQRSYFCRGPGTREAVEVGLVRIVEQFLPRFAHKQVDVQLGQVGVGGIAGHAQVPEEHDRSVHWDD